MLSEGKLEELEKELFAFFGHKYVQRADSRQRGLGLQYTEAETHDLARTVASFIAAREAELAALRAQAPAPVGGEVVNRMRLFCEPGEEVEYDAAVAIARAENDALLEAEKPLVSLSPDPTEGGTDE